MKIRWWIEGAGCPFQECGLHKGELLEIPDDEIPDNGEAKEKYIYDVVQDEFDRRVYPQWETVE